LIIKVVTSLCRIKGHLGYYPLLKSGIFTTMNERIIIKITRFDSFFNEPNVWGSGLYSPESTLLSIRASGAK
jgi:hypothetical protein